MNFDNRSLALNDEANLMVLDRAVGEKMTRIFLDDLRSAEEITAPTFRQRSWFQWLMERGASLVTRLL
jgi:cardiolipin synthase